MTNMMISHPLEGLSELFLNDTNYSVATQKSYRITYKYYIHYLKTHDILYASTKDIIAFREARRTLGHSTYYIHIQICALRALYGYLRLNQKRLDLPIEYAYDIMIPIKSEPIKHALRKQILTLDQARHLILHTKKRRQYIWHFRDHAIIYLMLTSGLRSDEIIHLMKDDFISRDGVASLSMSRKSDGKKIVINLSKGAHQAMIDYLSKRKDDHPYLFISHKNLSQEGYLSRMFMMTMFKKLLVECGLKDTKITPHSLRHSAAYFNLLRGGSLEQTKALLRHQNIQSTLIYQDYIQRMNDDFEEKIDAFILKEDGFTPFIIIW